MLKNAAALMAQGYTIDDTCYPWIAYKGPRFNPEDYHECFTELESDLFSEIVSSTSAWEHIEKALTWLAIRSYVIDGAAIKSWINNQRPLVTKRTELGDKAIEKVKAL